MNENIQHYSILNKTNILSDIIFLIVPLLIALWYILPSQMIAVKPFIVIVLYMMLIVPLLFKKNCKVNAVSMIVVLIVCSLSLAMLYYCHTFQNDLDKARGIITQTFINYMPIFIPLVLINKRPRVLKLFLIGVLIMLLFVMFKTVSQMIIDPSIVRQLAHGDELLNEYRVSNVGGFGFAYGCCFIIICLISYYFLNHYTIKLSNKLILVSTVGLLVLFEIKAAYFTAIVLIVISLLLINIKQKKIGTTIVTFFLFFLLLCFIYSVPFWADYGSNTLLNKLIDISNLMFNNELGVSTSARYYTYEASLDIFWNNMLFGANIGRMSGGSIGSHSSVLDTLAKTGIFGGIIYYIILRYARKTMLLISDNHSTQVVIKAVFIIYIILAFLNPVLTSHEIGFYVFALTPCMTYYFEGRVDNK